MQVSKILSFQFLLLALLLSLCDAESSLGQTQGGLSRFPNQSPPKNYLKGLLRPRKKLDDSKTTGELSPEQKQKLLDIAKDIGLKGRWIVLEAKVDGKFTDAQIGQQPNDVISIVPGKDTSSPLSMG